MKNNKIETKALSLFNYIILGSILFWFYMLRHILTYFIELIRLMLHTINLSEVSLESKCMVVLTFVLISISSDLIKEKNNNSMKNDDILAKRMAQALVVGLVVIYIILHTM
ncbi:hypothetical protein [Clostridium sp. VAP23]|uniref:hypothetical protein n=1 Tax=Clostridium sp. VAP23 TaxID=2949981 RepID=UPI00207A53E9|nr:hypothetical protein [Clostridium sp. VAP23]